MNNELYDMIFKRKSFHLFRDIGNEKIGAEELQQIEQIWSQLDPLCHEIKTAIRIVKAENTTCKRGEEYCILLYSEKKGSYLQNIGYLGEQLDLYLVSRNIGTLWFGIGKTEEKQYDGLDFIIMIAIARVSDENRFRKDMFRSKRKCTEEIWEGEYIDGVTDIVRFAPSACNTQPWLIRNHDVLEVFRYRKEGKRGIMPIEMVQYYNRIDIGIFLCFLELCLNHRGIEYERELFADNGGEETTVLNAIYKKHHD